MCLDMLSLAERCSEGVKGMLGVDRMLLSPFFRAWSIIPSAFNCSGREDGAWRGWRGGEGGQLCNCECLREARDRCHVRESERERERERERG